jgi:hypothetical protein
MAITAAQVTELNAMSDRDGVQLKTNRAGTLLSVVNSAATSGGLAYSSADSGLLSQVVQGGFATWSFLFSAVLSL